MLGIGEKLPAFKVAGVRLGFDEVEQNGVSAALQTGTLCPCNRPVGGEVLDPAA